jgi:hypothetical protein
VWDFVASIMNFVVLETRELFEQLNYELLQHEFNLFQNAIFQLELFIVIYMRSGSN